MENICELTKEINEIIRWAESGSMDLKEASVRIGVTDKLFKIYESQLKYNKLRKEGGVHIIDFMEGEFDDLPSSELIENAKALIGRAKKEIEKLRTKHDK
jgi:hypothetical protein